MNPNSSSPVQAERTETASGLPVRRNPSKVRKTILSVEEVRAATLALLGITPDLRRQAVEAFTEALEATTAKGRPKHVTRMQAAREILKLAGDYPSKTEDRGHQAPVTVEVTVADWAAPKPVTGTATVESRGAAP